MRQRGPIGPGTSWISIRSSDANPRTSRPRPHPSAPRLGRADPGLVQDESLRDRGLGGGATATGGASASGGTNASSSGAPGDGGPDGGDGGDAGTDAGPVAPPLAAAAGYVVNTFTSTFEQSTVDLANTQKSGFTWYLGQFFGSAATPASDLTFNADGTLSLNGAGTSSNAGINTATPSTNSAGWVGVAFGGGAYFEATFKFNPQDTITANGNGWPSWWAMAIEHLAGLPDEQWQGQPTSYDHFIETDFFEYDVWSFEPHYEYGGAMHDWYGIWKQTCPNNYCNVSNAGSQTNFDNFVVQTPSTTDFTQNHAFGFLWIPATSTTEARRSTTSMASRPTTRSTWSPYSASAPPPGLRRGPSASSISSTWR